VLVAGFIVIAARFFYAFAHGFYHIKDAADGCTNSLKPLGGRVRFSYLFSVGLLNASLFASFIFLPLSTAYTVASVGL